jgi:hypothetical protein
VPARKPGFDTSPEINKVTLSGAISKEGVRWVPEGELIPWSRFSAAKLNDRAALLFLNNWFPVPLHESMFANEADWQSFCDLLRESRVRVSRFRRRVAAG